MMMVMMIGLLMACQPVGALGDAEAGRKLLGLACLGCERVQQPQLLSCQAALSHCSRACNRKSRQAFLPLGWALWAFGRSGCRSRWIFRQSQGLGRGHVAGLDELQPFVPDSPHYVYDLVGVDCVSVIQGGELCPQVGKVLRAVGIPPS
jgi:hypothetical protein